MLPRTQAHSKNQMLDHARRTPSPASRAGRPQNGIRLWAQPDARHLHCHRRAVDQHDLIHCCKKYPAGSSHLAERHLESELLQPTYPIPPKAMLGRSIELPGFALLPPPPGRSFPISRASIFSAIASYSSARSSRSLFAWAPTITFAIERYWRARCRISFAVTHLAARFLEKLNISNAGQGSPLNTTSPSPTTDPEIECQVVGIQEVSRRRAKQWREAAPRLPDGRTRKAYLALAEGYQRLADLIEKEKSVERVIETDAQLVNLSEPTTIETSSPWSAIRKSPAA